MLLFVVGYCVVDMNRPEPLPEPFLGLPKGLDPRAVSIVVENELTGAELFNDDLVVARKSPVIMSRLQIDHMTSVTTELHVVLGRVVAGQVVVKVLHRPDYNRRLKLGRL